MSLWAKPSCFFHALGLRGSGVGQTVLSPKQTKFVIDLLWMINVDGASEHDRQEINFQSLSHNDRQEEIFDLSTFCAGLIFFGFRTSSHTKSLRYVTAAVFTFREVAAYVSCRCYIICNIKRVASCCSKQFLAPNPWSSTHQHWNRVS